LVRTRPHRQLPEAKGRYAGHPGIPHATGRRIATPRLGYLGDALALAGQRDEAMALLRKNAVRGQRPDEGNGWVHSSYIQVGLGEKAAALTSLENSYAHHETDVNYIGRRPDFSTPSRGEPRYRSFSENSGFGSHRRTRAVRRIALISP